VDWREDIDVGIERSAQHLAAWRARDPVGRLIASLTERDPGLHAKIEQLQAEVDERAGTDWQLALADPYPDEASILQHVYANAAGAMQ
jgi:TPP-dependent pyruvate/acetoin dehydrogenase alpha subunit